MILRSKKMCSLFKTWKVNNLEREYLPHFATRKVNACHVLQPWFWTLALFCNLESEHFPGCERYNVNTFRAAKHGEWTLAAFCNPESEHFPGCERWKVNTFRAASHGKWIGTGLRKMTSENKANLSTSGKWQLSGLCNLESIHFPRMQNPESEKFMGFASQKVFELQKIVQENYKSIKYIPVHKNRQKLICKCLGLWIFCFKIAGSSKDHF